MDLSAFRDLYIKCEHAIKLLNRCINSYGIKVNL